ncbi:MAG: zinc ribbon domain-containing protein [Ruminococcaceae bacterium]|nr:zinc ribbon domain-containing protein [Oscillospiraceae bacterium]
MFCSKCSAQIPDNSKFCGVCGAPIQTTYGQTSYTPPVAKEYTLAEEKESLDNFARFFKYERLAWKIEGIVILVLSCLFAGLGFIFFMAATAEEFFASVGAIYMLYGLLFLPVAIVNLKMVSRAEHYMNIVYTDAAAVEERAGNVGMIVLAAFFNSIALIFIIINFVRSKTEKDVLKSAKNRQEEFRRNNNM